MKVIPPKVKGKPKITASGTLPNGSTVVINDNGTGYFQSNFLVGGTTTSPGATFHVKNSYASVKIDSDGANNDVNLYFKIGANKKNIINKSSTNRNN